MNGNDYYRAMLSGVVIGAGFLTLFLVFLIPAEDIKPKEAPKSLGTFTIVSEYKGCDVVRWHDDMLAEYKYFLDCSNK
jgi:hypothetical protein